MPVPSPALLPPAIRGRSSPRRARRSEETRERIFLAALELIARDGMDGITIEQITERAGVGKGTFFRHFGGKEEVIAQFAVTECARVRTARERGAIHGSARQQILAIVALLSTHPGLTPELARGLYVSLLHSPKPTAGAESGLWEIRELLARVVREGQQSGEFRSDASALDAGGFLFGQYFLALLIWCSGPDSEPLAQVAERFTRLALDGLSGNHR